MTPEPRTRRGELPDLLAVVAAHQAALRRWRWVALLLAGVLSGLVVGFLVGLARPRSAARP
jgi:hypothetical protein